MIHKTGNLFDSEQFAIGHGVNTKGVMGAGIAKGFRAKYPDMYSVYKGQCDVKGLLPGQTLIVAAAEPGFEHPYGQDDRLIVNMASQDKPGPDARYEWLFTSALAAAKQLKSLGIYSCAIPQIGCGIGGLEWERAEALLYAIEDIVGSFEWEVWTYQA